MQARTISPHEIKKIMKEMHHYKQTTDKEIKHLHIQIIKLQKLIEKNVIPEDSPDSYEIKAIKDFESKRKKGNMKFVPLNSSS